MSARQMLIVVILAAAIFGAAAYFTRGLLVEEGRVAPGLKQFTPTEYVHPNVAILKKARELFAAGKAEQARDLLISALLRDPKSPVTQEMRDLVGEINTGIFFSKESSPRKTRYVVKPGDSLYKIAHALRSTTAAILQVNALNSNLIHPGDKLSVPKLDFTITIDLPRNRVVVHDSHGFFTQYAIAAVDLPRTRPVKFKTKVLAKTFWKDGKSVRADTPKSQEGTPWIQLRRPSYVLYGVKEESETVDASVEIGSDETESERDRPPKGIAMLKKDVEELQLLIRKGTPVTILREHQ